MKRKVINQYSMAIALAIAIVLLYIYDPEHSNLAYKCPFKSLTGLDCPGCGGQRAVHALLHFRIKEAIAYNPFLILVSIYILLVVILKNLRGCIPEKLQKAINSSKAAQILPASAKLGNNFEELGDRG